jgi:hypothetical protein
VLSSTVLSFANFDYITAKTVTRHSLAVPRSSVDEPVALKKPPSDTFVKARKASLQKNEEQTIPVAGAKEADNNNMPLKIVVGIAVVALASLVVAWLIKHHKEIEAPHLPETPPPSNAKSSKPPPKISDPNAKSTSQSKPHNSSPNPIQPTASNPQTDESFYHLRYNGQTNTWEPVIDNTTERQQHEDIIADLTRQHEESMNRMTERLKNDAQGTWQNIDGTEVWIETPQRSDGEVPKNTTVAKPPKNEQKPPKNEQKPPNTDHKTQTKIFQEIFQGGLNWNTEAHHPNNTTPQPQPKTEYRLPNPSEQGGNHHSQTGFTSEASGSPHTHTDFNQESTDFWAEFEAKRKRAEQEMNDYLKGVSGHSPYPPADDPYTHNANTGYDYLNSHGLPYNLDNSGLNGYNANSTYPHNTGGNYQSDWQQQQIDVFLQQSQQQSDEFRKRCQEQQDELLRQQEEERRRAWENSSQNLNWDSDFGFGS